MSLEAECNVSRGDLGNTDMVDEVPCSGDMFSSCAPCSAFVEGVKRGSGSC